MSEVRACPWGHEAELIAVTVDDYYTQNYAVTCCDDECCMTTYYPTKREAVDAWENRPAEDKLRAENVRKIELLSDLLEASNRCATTAIEELTTLKERHRADLHDLEKCRKKYLSTAAKLERVEGAKVGLRDVPAKIEVEYLLGLISRLITTLPNEKRDYSGVRWCAGCGAVQWVTGDDSPPDPCKPNCVLQEAKALAGQEGAVSDA